MIKSNIVEFAKTIACENQSFTPSMLVLQSWSIVSFTRHSIRVGVVFKIGPSYVSILVNCHLENGLSRVDYARV